MKPSALEVKRVKAQEAQGEILSVLATRLSAIESRLDAIMAALKIGESGPAEEPVKPPPAAPGKSAK